MNTVPATRRKSGFTLIELLVVIAIIAILAAILFPVFARARENARRASCQSNEKNIALGFKQYIQDSNDKYPPAIADSTALKNSAALEPYIKSTAIFYCPSDSNKTAGSYGYMLNGQNESAIQNTETTALLKETSPSRHFEGQNIAFVDGHVKWGKGTGEYATGATQGSATPPATPSLYTAGPTNGIDIKFDQSQVGNNVTISATATGFSPNAVAGYCYAKTYTGTCPTNGVNLPAGIKTTLFTWDKTNGTTPNDFLVFLAVRDYEAGNTGYTGPCRTTTTDSSGTCSFVATYTP